MWLESCMRTVHEYFKKGRREEWTALESKDFKMFPSRKSHETDTLEIPLLHWRCLHMLEFFPVNQTCKYFFRLRIFVYFLWVQKLKIKRIIYFRIFQKPLLFSMKLLKVFDKVVIIRSQSRNYLLRLRSGRKFIMDPLATDPDQQQRFFYCTVYSHVV